MQYSTGDILRINGARYSVIGIITYRNTDDNCDWNEYRLMSIPENNEAWLSMDDIYKEYSISFMVRHKNIKGFHEVDRGRQIVIAAQGNVDVIPGDKARFIEYEDSTEERIFSVEKWDDETEYSEGYYLDLDEIALESMRDSYYTGPYNAGTGTGTGSGTGFSSGASSTTGTGFSSGSFGTGFADPPSTGTGFSSGSYGTEPFGSGTYESASYGSDFLSGSSSGSYGSDFSSGSGFSSSSSSGFDSHSYTPGTLKKKKSKKLVVFIVVIAVVIVSIPLLNMILEGIFGTKSISDYLEDDDTYTYVTSITGKENQKADVYKAQAPITVDIVAKSIIENIEGETQYVQQNTAEIAGTSSDASSDTALTAAADAATDAPEDCVAILTEDEYCIVYQGENGDVLIQISDREYAYTSDNNLYQGRTASNRFFRRFYHSTGYFSDATRYTSHTSPYSSFSDSDISYSSTDTYHTYSNSIRQSSIRSRKSSSGGISSGK